MFICGEAAQTASPPKQKQIGEYNKNFLLFPYQAESGASWGQWLVPKKVLPKYKRAIDIQSPAPPEVEFRACLEARTNAKRGNYLTPEEDFIRLPISEHFGNGDKIPEI